MGQGIPDPRLDLQAVLDRIGGDRELLVEIIAIFLETMPALLERLRAMDAAGDCATVVALAHELKGASANLGALEMVRQARLLEMSARQKLVAQTHEHCVLLQREFEQVRELLEAYRQDSMCGGDA